MASAPVDALGPPARPLVLAKLQAPVPRERVSRPVLLDLCKGHRRKLTLVRAPAGWGKSTLLADWHASTDETRPFAWLALDQADNDPATFWTYVIEALRTQHAVSGERSLATLQAPRVDVITDVLPDLYAELDTLPHDVVLVLDDYHLVTNPEIDDSLAFFVEHLPSTLEIALASRSEPSLPLARLRARGHLVEIVARDLGFSDEEAGLLLNDLHGLGLDDQAVAQLRERTEGWPAGLYLAALTLRGRLDPDAFIDDFAGDDRHIVDYLSAEVLLGQPDDIKAFLLQTSVLDRFCATLCDAVTERDDSRRILRELESSNFFLVPLDTKRDWYRYHHLFRDLLRLELELIHPEQLTALHRRAHAWHRDVDSAPDAIRHATAAGDIAEASELILSHWLENRDLARLETLLGWLSGLPADAVLADARLCLVRATTLQEMGRIVEADHWLEAAERADATAHAGSSATRAGIAGARAINHYFAGDAAGIRAAVAPALELDTDGSDYWKSALLTTLGIATYVEGHEADAAALLEEAVRAGVASDHTLALIHALGWCAIVHYGRGESEQGDRVVDQTESLLQARPGMTAYYGAAMAHLARGAKHEHEGRISEAESEVARAVELARRGDAKFEVVLGLAAHTRLKGQLGDRSGAKGLLGEARQAISECVDPGVLPSLVATVERDLRLAPRQPTQAIYAEDLSERELAVLRLLPSDLTQREISSHLYVSFNTVKTHNKSIFQKLGVSTRHEAVRRAQELGLL